MKIIYGGPLGTWKVTLFTCKEVSILLRNLKLTLFYVMKPDDLKSTMPILKSVVGQGCGGMEAKGLKPP